MGHLERELYCLVLACFVGLPIGALVFGWGRMFVGVLTGTYTNDNIDFS
jgi:hypothetical protein